MIHQKEVCKMFCEFFNVKKIEDIGGLSYKMMCGYEKVDVVVNLNKEGQIQIKLMKDGTMASLADNYLVEHMVQLDFTKMLLVVDFKNKSIRFKDPETLSL